MDKNKKKGFTLVELIVVLAILAILAAMLVPALTGYIDKANEKKVIATARQYYVAAQTVVSEAYAENKAIKSISINGENYTVEVFKSKEEQHGGDIYDTQTGKESKWMREFLALSEFANADMLGVQVENGKITYFTVFINSKMVVLQDDEFIVY